jgi:hypothetical protein
VIIGSTAQWDITGCAEIPNGELAALVRLPVGAAMLCDGDYVRGARRKGTNGIRQ